MASRRSALRVRWDRVGRIGLLVVLAIVVGLYFKQGLSLLSTRSQAGQQAAIVRHLQGQNARLARQRDALNDPATIVREARALGMVRPGERPYALIGSPGH